MMVFVVTSLDLEFELSTFCPFFNQHVPLASRHPMSAWYATDFETL